MRFKVGDILRNETSKEEGRIVRIAHLSCFGYCYVVPVALDQAIWDAPPREAIWRRSEVTRLAGGSRAIQAVLRHTKAPA